jgi:hypothetical protein
MDQFFKLFSSVDQLLIIASVILILIGLVTPKRFLGIEVDWNPAKSAAVVIIGVLLLGFSVGHIFWWHPQGYDPSSDLGRYDNGPNDKPNQPKNNSPTYGSGAPDGGSYGGADIYPNKPHQGPDVFDTFTPDDSKSKTAKKKPPQSN